MAVDLVEENYTRALADIEQIVRCKQTLKGVDTDITNLSKVFYMVGNDVRLAILYLLNEEDKLCVCDLADVLEMTIPAVSQHLRKLKRYQLVGYTKSGSTTYYHISSHHKAIIRTVISLVELKKSKLLQGYI